MKCYTIFCRWISTKRSNEFRNKIKRDIDELKFFPKAAKRASKISWLSVLESCYFLLESLQLVFHIQIISLAERLLLSVCFDILTYSKIQQKRSMSAIYIIARKILISRYCLTEFLWSNFNTLYNIVVDVILFR